MLVKEVMTKKVVTIDTDKINEKITPKTSAILATHIFGNPCSIKDLEEISEDNKLKLVFDSAHGAGSIYKGKKIANFGNGEVFSMSPTKVLTAGEGGLVSTNDDKLAELLKINLLTISIFPSIKGIRVSKFKIFFPITPNF